MNQTIRAVLGIGLAWACGGCALFEASMRTTAYQGGMEGAFVVRLAYAEKYSIASDDPGRNYRKLELMTENCPSDECIWRVIAQRPISAKEKAARDGASEFKLGAIDGWLDATHERVWLVERSSDRVVATWDRRSGVVTGIDDARPTWAVGGELMSVRESAACDGVVVAER